MSANLKDDIENAVFHTLINKLVKSGVKTKSGEYVPVSSIRAAMQKISDRAAFCRAKGNETSDPVIKMSYLAEATGLLQANIKILEQLEKEELK